MNRDGATNGIIACTVIAAGWILAATWLVPWLRDAMAAQFAAGAVARITDVWPPPTSVTAGAALAGALILVGATLLYKWSARRQGLGTVVDATLQSPYELAVALAVWTAVVSAAVLSNGDPSLGDAKTHIARSWMWEESLREGAIPVWTDLWYGGFLIDHHYPPLSHVAAAAVGLVGASPYTAAKIIVWLSAIAGAVGFGLWCRSFHRCNQSGFLGGVIYSLLPTIDAAWMWQGRLPGVVLMGLLPWAFLATRRLALGDGGRRAAAGLALCLAAIVLAHSVQARLAMAVLIVYAITEFTLRRGARTGWLLTAWAVGLSLSLCFLIPVYLERGWVNDIVMPPVRFLSLAPMIHDALPRALRWSPRGDFYAGATVLVLAVAAVWPVTRAIRDGGRSRRYGVSLLALIVAPWLFATKGRLGDAELMFIGLACAAAACVAHTGRWRRSHLLLLAIVLLLIDLGPANLVSTYVTHGGGKAAAYENVAATLGSGRYLELSRQPGGTVRSSYWHYVPAHRVACVGGPFIQGAPRSFTYRAAMIDTLAAALSAGTDLPQSLSKLLAFENVRLISVSTPTEIAPPLTQPPPGFVIDAALPAWRSSDASLVSLLDSVPPPPFTDPPRVHSLGIGTDVSGNRPASRRVVTAALAWMESAGPTPVDVTEWRRRPNAVEFEIPDVGEATLRIALAGYPTTIVRSGAVPVTWREGPLGGILVDVLPGAHRVSVEVHSSRTRRYLGVLLLVLTVVVAALFVVPERATSAPSTQ
jgi:hypothetical protein